MTVTVGYVIFPGLEQNLRGIIRAWLLGVAILCYIFAALGILGLLNPVNLLLSLTSIFFIGCIKFRLTDLAKILQSFSRNVSQVSTTRKLSITISICLAGVYLRSLSIPINGYDALAYHIYLPLRALYQDHFFDARKQLPMNGLPIGFDGLRGWYSLGTSIEINWLINYAVILCIILLSMQILKRVNFFVKFVSIVGIFSLIVIAGPVTWANPETDLIVVAYFLAIIEWVREKDHSLKSVIPISTLIGFGIFSKFHIALALIPFAIQFVNKSLNEKNNKPKIMIWSLGLVSLPIMIWQLKNFLQVRNPLYPFFTSFFRGEHYNPLALTNEAVISMSWDQARFTFANSNFFDFSELMKLQIYFASGVIILGIFSHMLLKVKPSPEFTMLVVAALIQLYFMGLVYRYYLYLLIPILVLFFENFKHTNKSKVNIRNVSTRNNRNVSRIARTQIIKRLNGSNLVVLLWCLMITLPALHLNEILQRQSALKSIQTGSSIGYDFYAEDEALLAVKFIRGLGKGEVCITGDARAQMFWPRKVTTLGSDLRNPFANENSDANQTFRSLRMYECEFLVIHTGWRVIEATNALRFMKNSGVKKYRSIYENRTWTVWKNLQ
jgi:hypothetical protein